MNQYPKLTIITSTMEEVYAVFYSYNDGDGYPTHDLIAVCMTVEKSYELIQNHFVVSKSKMCVNPTRIEYFEHRNDVDSYALDNIREIMCYVVESITMDTLCLYQS